MQDQDTVYVELRARDGTVRDYAAIDAADAEWVGQWRWYLGSHGYAMRIPYPSRRAVLLHRALLGLAAGDIREGDHINRDRLDNRRENLRVVSRVGNAENVSGQRDKSSKHRGVSWDKVNRQWKAQVGANGKRHNIGRFETEHEAAEAARLARARLLPNSTD